MRLERDLDDEEPALPLTSLIDVVFLLLIFFMVTTTFLEREQRLALELPLAESGAEAQRAPEELTIDVMPDGGFALAGRAVSSGALGEALRAAAQRDPATPVLIRGDRAARHEHVVAVLDACGVAGLSNLSVGTLEAPGG